MHSEMISSTVFYRCYNIKQKEKEFKRQRDSYIQNDRRSVTQSKERALTAGHFVGCWLRLDFRLSPRFSSPVVTSTSLPSDRGGCCHGRASP